MPKQPAYVMMTVEIPVPADTDPSLVLAKAGEWASEVWSERDDADDETQAEIVAIGELIDELVSVEVGEVAS